MDIHSHCTVTKDSTLARDHLWWVAIATPYTPGSVPAVRSCDKTHVHDTNQQVLSQCMCAMWSGPIIYIFQPIFLC